MCNIYNKITKIPFVIRKDRAKDIGKVAIQAAERRMKVALSVLPPRSFVVAIREVIFRWVVLSFGIEVLKEKIVSCHITKKQRHRNDRKKLFY